MSTVTQHTTGMFCWTQLGTTDRKAAMKFYADLFGWTTEEASMDGHPFTLLKKHGNAVGMVYDMKIGQQGDAPNWTPFVAVDSADDIADKVRKAGGKVLMEPMDAGKNGRQAVLQDPTRAVFCVWQAGAQPGAGIVNEPGSMVWEELITDDAQKAGRFYEQVFGWTRKPMKSAATGPSGQQPDYTIFENHGTQAAGLMQATPDMHLTHPYWLTYFGVDDCDRSAQQAERLGGKVNMKPTDIPGIGRFAVLTDPQNAWFAIIAMEKKA